MTDTLSTITHIIHATISTDEPITAETVLRDLGADDIDILQIVMGVEDGLVVTIDDDEAENLRTVGDIVRLVEAKQAPAEAGAA